MDDTVPTEIYCEVLRRLEPDDALSLSCVDRHNRTMVHACVHSFRYLSGCFEGQLMDTRYLALVPDADVLKVPVKVFSLEDQLRLIRHGSSKLDVYFGLGPTQHKVIDMFDHASVSSMIYGNPSALLPSVGSMFEFLSTWMESRRGNFRVKARFMDLEVSFRLNGVLEAKISIGNEVGRFLDFKFDLLDLLETPQFKRFFRRHPIEKFDAPCCHIVNMLDMIRRKKTLLKRVSELSLRFDHGGDSVWGLAALPCLKKYRVVVRCWFDFPVARVAELPFQIDIVITSTSFMKRETYNWLSSMKNVDLVRAWPEDDKSQRADCVAEYSLSPIPGPWKQVLGYTRPPESQSYASDGLEDSDDDTDDSEGSDGDTDDSEDSDDDTDDSDDSDGTDDSDDDTDDSDDDTDDSDDDTDDSDDASSSSN